MARMLARWTPGENHCLACGASSRCPLCLCRVRCLSNGKHCSERSASWGRARSFLTKMINHMTTQVRVLSTVPRLYGCRGAGRMP